jgi:hypothetical protein
MRGKGNYPKNILKTHKHRQHAADRETKKKKYIDQLAANPLQHGNTMSIKKCILHKGKGGKIWFSTTLKFSISPYHPTLIKRRKKTFVVVKIHEARGLRF